MIILPSLEIVPAKFNGSTLLSQIPIDGTGDFTVTRATSATRVNGNGLIEVAKTNLAFNSQTWNASNNWQLSESSGRVTVVTSTSGTLAPDGTSTANAISPTSGNITHYFYSNSASAVNYVSGAVFTISAFFKKGIGNSGRYIQLTTANSRFVGNPYANFDLELGIALTVSGSVADSNRVSRIQNYENGWYRCSLTATCNNSTSITNGVVAALLTEDTNARLGAAFAGNTNDYIFGWGAQLEEGSFASEYIPTTTVARTRFAGVTVDGTAAANIPRLDYLQPDGTIGCPALLVEPAATNLCLQSEAFNTTWTRVSGGTGLLPVITANAVVAPDGTMTADTVVFDRNAVSGSANFSQLQQDINFPTSGTYTFGVYAKATTSGDVGKQFYIRTRNALVSGSLTSSWVRYTSTETGLSSGNNPVYIGNRGGFTADQTVSVDLWGAQLELGSVATSYIPTTVSGVTRAADVITDTTASGIIGQTEGTIYLEVDAPSASSQFFRINVSTLNAIHIYKNASDRYQVRIYPSASFIDLTDTSAKSGFVKIAIAYKSGESALVINGGTPITSATAYSFSAALNSVNFLGGVEPVLPARIRATALYPTRLTNTQLALLTSPYTSYSSMASALSYTLG
jgi:hypothetical protein